MSVLVSFWCPVKGAAVSLLSSQNGTTEKCLSSDETKFANAVVPGLYLPVVETVASSPLNPRDVAAEGCVRDCSKAAVTNHSPAAAKIVLFRSLFRGREDVYPRRFENRKTGKMGYAPACGNEWVRGICEKPRIKCSKLSKSAFSSDYR